MANKLKMAHERRKLALRARILGNRAKIAQLQEETKRAREEVRSMAPRKAGLADQALRAVKVR